MSTLAPPPFPMFGMPPGPIRRWTVQEYHQMIAAGILTEYDRVELLEGWIVQKPLARSPPYAFTVENGREVLSGLLPAGWKVRTKSAITTPVSEPEPDLVVVQGNVNSHCTRHPEPYEIALVVEVPDTELAYYRVMKARTYALAGIACYWIVNLAQRQIEVYSHPSGPDKKPAFAQRHDFLPGDSVRVVIAGEHVALIPVSDLLPP